MVYQLSMHQKISYLMSFRPPGYKLGLYHNRVCNDVILTPWTFVSFAYLDKLICRNVSNEKKLFTILHNDAIKTSSVLEGFVVFKCINFTIKSAHIFFSIIFNISILIFPLHLPLFSLMYILFPCERYSFKKTSFVRPMI